MIADRGTAIVAVRSGEVEFKHSRLGGNAVWLTTTTGDRYYYAHLDRFQGSSRAVVRGEVIGYVGSTGNAGGPHLHFETLPNGAAVNPFGAVFGACVDTPDTVNWAGVRSDSPSASTRPTTLRPR
jgi:murein DD-endopeptidase MepM/ murein hydrolase activator NlpD